MQIIADLDENNQAYLLGFVYCSQLREARQVRFYVDTGSTVTTLLDIDVVRLGLKWQGLEQTKCDTAAGVIYPYILPRVTVFLKNIVDSKVILNAYPLKTIHLIPPEDPTKIVPIQYEFCFSLLGMDVLEKFSDLKFNFKEKKMYLIT